MLRTASAPSWPGLELLLILTPERLETPNAHMGSRQQGAGHKALDVQGIMLAGRPASQTSLQCAEQFSYLLIIPSLRCVVLLCYILHLPRANVPVIPQSPTPVGCGPQCSSPA